MADYGFEPAAEVLARAFGDYLFVYPRSTQWQMQREIWLHSLPAPLSPACLPHPSYSLESMLWSPMSKPSGASFSRRMPDNITEELVAVLSSKASFEFKPLFEIILANLRERNAASGGEEMLRLRAYEKLQGLVGQGVVNRTVNGTTKKYKGVAPRLLALSAEMKILRKDWDQRSLAKAAAAR